MRERGAIQHQLESKKTVSRRAQIIDRPASARLSDASGSGTNSLATSDNEDSVSFNG